MTLGQEFLKKKRFWVIFRADIGRIIHIMCMCEGDEKCASTTARAKAAIVSVEKFKNM